MFTSELGGMAIFIEELRHTLNTDGRAIIKFGKVFAQVQFKELFAFVAQTIFRLCPWQLEARLSPAFAGTSYTTT
ncbi:hypothetical protein D3C80_2108430 [compost metagenome]